MPIQSGINKPRYVDDKTASMRSWALALTLRPFLLRYRRKAANVPEMESGMRRHAGRGEDRIPVTMSRGKEGRRMPVCV
jgi:hypothetical protein